ncbi:MAG: MlaD family protein [Acidobacteriaceae bacterium]|nr:MlaD family protein [Acidobacteriaceae bacterium]
MPSQQEVRWSQLKVGLIVIAASILLVTLLFLMTSSSGIGIFSRRLTIVAYFQNSQGLKEGAAVNLQGVTIGTVRSVTFVNAPDRKQTPVRVVMRINGNSASDVRKDSTATLITVGVLGDTVVDLNSQNAAGPPIQNGDELKPFDSPGFNDIAKASTNTIENMNTLVAKMNVLVENMQNGKGSLGQVVVNPALYNNANGTLVEMRRLAADLNQGKGSAGKLLTDDELYNRLNAAAGKLESIANDLDSGKGTMGRLLKDDTLYNNLNSTVAHANSLLTEADAGKGGLGLMLKDPQFRSRLNDTVTQLDTLIKGINDGKGTLGKLATDDETHTNLNHLLTESSGLVTAIRQNPKKYLVIHLKIF